MSDDLKPCPFCGGRAAPDDVVLGGADFYALKCNHCLSQSAYTESLMTAAARWNTRARPDDTAQSADIAHLRAALERITSTRAFFVAAGDIDPETWGRMTYARLILNGESAETAEATAQYEAHRRGFPDRPEFWGTKPAALTQAHGAGKD